MAEIIPDLDGDELLEELAGLTDDEQAEIAEQIAGLDILQGLKDSPAAMEEDKLTEELQRQWLSLRNPAIWSELE